MLTSFTSITTLGAAQARIGNRVFILMQFDSMHPDVFPAIEEVCARCGLNAFRADRDHRPGPIIGQILEDMECASFTIADLTHLNPNVLYELGIAHARNYPVILIAQKTDEDLPFDVRGQRVQFYDLNTRGGSDDFRQRLMNAIIELRERRRHKVAKSLDERTRYVVDDLDVLRSLSRAELATTCVRTSSHLSIFAVEPQSLFGEDEKAAWSLLEEERDALLDLARRGCSIRCILSPPMEGREIPLGPERTSARLLQLIRLLESEDDSALKSIEWAISRFRQNNVYIIGNVSCIYGFKSEVQRGYTLTMRLTAPDAVYGSMDVFDALFEELVLPVGATARDGLRKHALQQLNASLEYCNSYKSRCRERVISQ